MNEHKELIEPVASTVVERKHCWKVTLAGVALTFVREQAKRVGIPHGNLIANIVNDEERRHRFGRFHNVPTEELINELTTRGVLSADNKVAGGAR